MIIALDYDETYTQDPALWNRFIEDCIKNGHRVICVTMRFNNEYEAPDVINSIGKLCEVIFTERHAKAPYLQQRGIFPHVWIDDRPYYIYENSRNL